MKKSIVSTIIAFVFFTMAVTGILLYVKQKAHAIEMTHTVFGLIFVVFALFHLYNNFKSLKNYTKNEQKTGLGKQFVVIFIAFAIILGLAITEVLEPVAEFGKIFAKPNKKQNQGVNFEEKSTNQDADGKTVSLIIQKGEKEAWARLTIDIVDSTDKVLENLYLPDTLREGPSPSLMLNTKIKSQAPFTLRITEKSREKQEVIKGLVSNLEAGVSQPINTENTGLKRVIVEVKK
jgi:hypothetical protein